MRVCPGDSFPRVLAPRPPLGVTGSSIRTSATSMPSAEVPLITPATIIASPRRRPPPCICPKKASKMSPMPPSAMPVATSAPATTAPATSAPATSAPSSSGGSSTDRGTGGTRSTDTGGGKVKQIKSSSLTRSGLPSGPAFANIASASRAKPASAARIRPLCTSAVRIWS